MSVRYLSICLFNLFFLLLSFSFLNFSSLHLSLSLPLSVCLPNHLKLVFGTFLHLQLIVEIQEWHETKDKRHEDVVVIWYATQPLDQQDALCHSFINLVYTEHTSMCVINSPKWASSKLTRPQNETQFTIKKLISV